MKKDWSKILFIVSDTIIAIYLLLAFTSFDCKGGTKAVCSKVDINIADGATNGFLDAATIKQNLQKAGCYPEINKPVDQVDTRRIEETLTMNTPFVKTAKCYKTEGGHVYISVTQRMPVIRIKAANGDDYYVDDNDRIMKSSNYTSDLIIATGSVNRAFATRYLSPLGKVVMANELWRNLIEQINVLPDLSIEIVPRIGDHVVCLGRLPEISDNKAREKAILDFMTRKMTRLEKFYKYGLSVVGWNKYSYINIEFDNQIICKKKNIHASATGDTETNTLPSETQPAANDNNGSERNQLANDNSSIKKEEKNNEEKEKQKTESKKAESKKTESKKAESKKTESKKAESKKAESKKTENKKAESKKAENKKTENKKTENKKTESKKAESKKAPSKNKTEKKK